MRKVLAPSLERNNKMPRYLVERTFPDGLSILLNEAGAAVCQTVVSTDAQGLVTWVHLNVTPDKKKMFCIYDAPPPEAVRKVDRKNSLPVEKITAVSVLDPSFSR